MVKLERPLRVLHIVSGDLWAGAEAQVFTLISHLQSMAAPEVVVLNEGELANRLRQLNIPTVILPEANMSSLHIFWCLIRIIFNSKPDVVHTHRQKENILGGFAFWINHWLGRAGISVRTVHGAAEFSARGLGRLQEKINIWVGRTIQAQLVAVSEDLRQKLIPIYAAQRLTLVRNGVDEAALTNQVPVKAELGATIHVGIIGRLEAVKRVDIFVAMAARLAACAPDITWRFHVVGDGGLATQLKLMAADLGLADQIIFHGQVNPVAPLLARLNVIVMCSDHEGTPMVALEALALGIPLVAHKVGGLTELLASEERLLVTNHESEGYAKAVLSYCRDPFVPPRLPPEYTAQHNAQAMLALYNRLLGGQ